MEIYNPSKLLSYNRILNFVMSEDDQGKLRGFKSFLIKRFLKHGEHFIYLRRHKTDLKHIKHFFEEMETEFPTLEFKVLGYNLYINGKICGCAVHLSSWEYEKSNSYFHVTNILFDGFLRNDEKQKYLSNEPKALLSFMDTVFREKEKVKCFCLSDSLTVLNPYFLFFNLIPNVEKRFSVYEDIVIEYIEDNQIEKNNDSLMYKLIENTDYLERKRSKQEGKKQSFVEKRTKESVYVFSIIYKNIKYGVWVDENKPRLYVSLVIGYNEEDEIINLSVGDSLLDQAKLKNWNKNYYLYKLVKALKQEMLYFETVEIRKTYFEMFSRMDIKTL